MPVPGFSGHCRSVRKRSRSIFVHNLSTAHCIGNVSIQGVSAHQLFSDSDAVRQSAHFLIAGRNGNKIQALELTGDDPSVMVSRTRESACSQGGKVTPNVCSRRWHDKRELAGRLAGRGNSLVLMGIRLGTVKLKVPDDLVNKAFAKPCHVVSPVLVRL